ncbi:rubredoxin [Niabella ginsengisoli]|uniref:rubredoxin n=1 Tax=Niabella ginsengisoli TaxID=522298 RepID=UPI00374D335E
MASLYQCQQCLSVYDNRYGDPENNIEPGVEFRSLADAYCCPVCEAPKREFKRVTVDTLSFQEMK